MIGYADICNHLGTSVKTIGQESFWQCPQCKDNGMDNLKFNHRKGILTCFADNSHSHEIWGKIAEKVPNCKQPHTVKNPQKLTIDIDYIIQCASELHNDEKAKDYLRKHRGLYGETLKLGIGIDKAKRQWVFPAIDFNSELIGAEYRDSDLTKKVIKKAVGTKSELCLVNNTTLQDKTLIVTEGFIDAYTLWQYFYENNQHYHYEIATPSNGAGTIAGLVNKINPANYKQIIFYLDNDEAGKKAVADIKSKAGFNFGVKFNKCNCCKDFNEHYRRHLAIQSV